MKNFSFILFLLWVTFACAGEFSDSVAVKRWTAGASCNHHLTYLAIDYPVGGAASVVEPIRDWMDSVVSCNGRIREDENPARICLECAAKDDERLKADFDVDDASLLGNGYDSTWIVYKSQTKSTVTYMVESTGYELVAAHGWRNFPTYVFLKGESRPLEYNDVFAFPKSAMIRYVRELARTEPSNQHDCGVKQGFSDFDWIFPTSKGLGFQWHTYAVNCGACGNVVLVLPYERFRGMFTKKFYELLPEFGADTN